MQKDEVTNLLSKLLRVLSLHILILLVFIILYIWFIWVGLFVWVNNIFATACIWRSEESLCELTLTHTMWVLGIKFRLLDLTTKFPSILSHLIGSRFIFHPLDISEEFIILFFWGRQKLESEFKSHWKACMPSVQHNIYIKCWLYYFLSDND